jgi:hypothetical protein
LKKDVKKKKKTKKRKKQRMGRLLIEWSERRRENLGFGIII